MDEMSSRMKANMERVLRAMDVIPPFDDDSSTSPSRPRPVPTLDLGEKILAEQRRMTARKRKSPSRAEVERADIREAEGIAELRRGVRPEEGADTVVVGGEGGSDEMAELHQIVADIVARDIERLREGLKRDSRYSA
jgi:hypothetical protein